MLIAFGVNRDGYREILGLMIGDSESEASWSEFFACLKGRGLKGVDLVVSDDHEGNREIRRRERVAGIFPNEGAVLMEIDEAWATGHRYLDMTEYWIWRDNQEKVKVENSSR